MEDPQVREAYYNVRSIRMRSPLRWTCPSFLCRFVLIFHFSIITLLFRSEPIWVRTIRSGLPFIHSSRRLLPSSLSIINSVVDEDKTPQITPSKLNLSLILFRERARCYSWMISCKRSHNYNRSDLIFSHSVFSDQWAINNDQHYRGRAILWRFNRTARNSIFRMRKHSQLWLMISLSEWWTKLQRKEEP